MGKPFNIRRLNFSTVALYAVIGAAIASSAGAFSSPPIIVPKTVTSSTSTSSLSASAAGAAVAPPTYALFGLSLKRASQLSNKAPLFSVPSIFGPSDARPIVLFDGKCNLCNAGVQLVLDNDRASSDPRGNLRVAALQSRVGKVLLARLPPEQRETVLSTLGDDGTSTGGGGEYKSIVVAGEHRTWLNSAACIKIGTELRGPLRYLAWLARIVPAFVRDPIYRLISPYRKRLFGEAPECRLWDDNWDTRFVNDALFGGRSGEIDPFADPNAVQEEEEDEDNDDDVDLEDAPPGSPMLNVGDRVRVISTRPILHRGGKLCSVGLEGTVTRVLERRAYPKNVAVTFELEGAEKENFEAHFFPGQLRKE